MARSSRQKLKLLYLSQYLLRCTDEEHPVTVAQMIEFLARQDISAERKSIYDDLEALRLFGLDVVWRRVGSARVYFIGERDFELPELKLLVDSVQSSRFITERKSMELIKKLERLTSENGARQLHRQVVVRGRVKTMNESIYYHVDDIQSAMEQDHPITFQYYEWNPARERVYRHGGKRYQVSPWTLMWDDENYYLIAFDHDAGFIKHFRVDKMDHIRVQKGEREGSEIFEGLDLAAYTDAHFGMFSGEVCRVRMRFVNRLAGPVIDRFGADVHMIREDEEHFTVTVNAAVNVQFFGWLCGFGDGVRILAPEEAVEQMREHVAAIAGLYAGE